MARGARRGRSRQVTLINQEYDQTEDIQTPGGEEANQVEVFAAESNRTVTQGTEIANTQAQIVSSYASLVDPEEGTELKFVSTEIIDGKQIAKIEREDNAVLCYVLGANPPYEIMQGFIKRIWRAFEIDKILQIRKGVFLVRFGSLQDKLTVEKRGVYYFDGKPLVVKGSNPQMDLQTENIKSLPIWVHYEWKPIKCSHCMMFGYEVIICRKKGGARTEWRPVQKDNLEGNSQEQPMQTSQ
ncbi:hypothetical protein Cgig2_025919 [Carnegiea gigantea]|uniref:DUF4283 domain-containing protein n=1 Tax=Carnegiea gigantea TaxID=171969 RepID=A0A9Q1JEQ6_9CARY|nr:hypothetical protein Cgig2_025919 [Carnegiea gigantea]